MSVGPVISAQWFPPQERLISTAFISLSNSVGAGMTFLIGPLVVPDGRPAEETRKNILHYLQYETYLFGVIYLLCLVYFPNKPPTSPSLTASVKREDYLQGMRSLFKNK